MSHFIGLVFLHPAADLDQVLEPFNEQNEEYMEFNDCTDEVEKRWDEMPDSCPSEGTYTKVEDMTDEINKIWDEAESFLSPEDENAFWKPYTKDKYPTPIDIARNKKLTIVPDKSKRDGVRFEHTYELEWQYEPSKEKYPTIDEFAKEYFGYCKVNGRYGYMSNPNAKYDWYSEGGRWGGFLINKEGNKTDEDYITEIDWEKTDIPFCFVGTDGVWYEKGKMGWWAMVSDEKKGADWKAEFNEYVNTLLASPDADKIEVYAIDFHI